MAFSIVAAFVGSSLSGARVAFAAAHDGLFFRGLARIHPRYGTPANSLILQSAITSLLLLAVGRFQALFSIAIFSQWLAYGLAASTLFVFRRRESADPHLFRVPGYPVVPVAFIASAAGLVIFAIRDRPADSFAGTMVILCGIPAYLLHRRFRPPC